MPDMMPAMDAAAHARELVAYNAWANRRVIGAMAAVDDAALSAPAAASKGGILETMAHVVAAQTIWLSRWKGEPNVPPDGSSREAVAAAVESSQAALEAFAETLDEGAWDRIVEYRDSAGSPHRVTLGRLLTHLVNHGTLHRGEAGFQLGLLGASPGDLDYVFFAFEREDGRA